MNVLTDLFFTFAKIGLFSFGGGYAMIPLIENICVDRKKWITHEEMMTVTVLAESTPGPVAINCSTFVGFRQAGFSGAFIATLGMILPSFIVIYLLSMFLNDWLEITIVAKAFRGIKIAVGILILNAGIRMMKKMRGGVMTKTIMVCSTAAMLLINIFSWNFSSISLMLITSAVSLTAYLVNKIDQRKGGEEA